jgi:hypothetical protein
MGNEPQRPQHTQHSNNLDEPQIHAAENHIYLASDHDRKVYLIPRIPKVRILTNYKPTFNDFEPSLQRKDHIKNPVYHIKIHLGAFILCFDVISRNHQLLRAKHYHEQYKMVKIFYSSDVGTELPDLIVLGENLD